MIRIVSKARLEGLEAEAARVSDLRERLAALHTRMDGFEQQVAETETLREQLAAARAEADQADRELDVLAAEFVGYRAAVADPEHGSEMQGRIALAVLRRAIADARESGHQAAIDRFRLLELLICDEAEAGARDVADAGTEAAS